MEAQAARQLAEACLPALARKGILESEEEVVTVRSRCLLGLWTGMGSVDEVMIECNNGAMCSFVAKNIGVPKQLEDYEEKRDFDSYFVEANFYEQGHADRLFGAGARCPLPLLIDRKEDGQVTICMTKLEGSCSSRNEARAGLAWLARLHALYWGDERSDEAVGTGLQAQGCYWHFDARQLEWDRMPTNGVEGRLRLAAAGIDQRLKADRMQTICHGDAKGANIMVDEEVGMSMYDFQWVGKAAATKDVAYFLACGGCGGSLENEDELVRFYHAELSTLLASQGDEESVPDLEYLKGSLRLAYCDISRWMSGWGWWGNTRLLQHHKKALLMELDGGKALASSEEYAERIMAAFPP